MTEKPKKNLYHYYAKTFHTLMMGAGAVMLFFAPLLASTHWELSVALGAIGGLLGGAAALPDLSDKVTKWMTIHGAGLLAAAPAILALFPSSKWTAIAAAVVAGLGTFGVAGAHIPQPGSRPAFRPSQAPPAPEPAPEPAAAPVVTCAACGQALPTP